jgi:Tetratricopeptide repeat
MSPIHQKRRRALIFDNCDDQADTTAEALLAARLPRSGGCRVLVTSRRGQWRRSLRIVAHPLGVPDRSESVALLRGYHDSLDAAAADAIAAELGDLPLALTLAGSYLETYRDEAFGAPAVYLANLRKQLLDHRSLQGAGAPVSLTGHELNVRATFELSYRRLNTADPVDVWAIAALARAACLAPGEPFPRDLLLATLAGDEDRGAADGEEAVAPRADALRRLVALGLLEVAEGGALRIHRLIVAFARAVSIDGKAQGAVEVVLLNIANRLNEYNTLSLLILQSHFKNVTNIAMLREDERAASLCAEFGFHLSQIGNFSTAQHYLDWALSIQERKLGLKHPTCATLFGYLGYLKRCQGDLSNARRYHEQALAIREIALGPRVDTAQSIRVYQDLWYTLAPTGRSQSVCCAMQPKKTKPIGSWT